MREFYNKSTNSKAKYLTEQYSDTLIKELTKTLTRINKDTKAGILVGSPKGLSRHINRLKALGFKESNIIIFEFSPLTAKKLALACKRQGYKCQVIYGEMLSQIDAFCRRGTKFTYIEFDGTKPFGTFDFKLYELANKYDIPIVISQGATRGTSKTFRQECKRLKFRQTYDAVQEYMRYELKRIAPKIIQNRMSKYVNEFITYKGVAGMYMHIAIKVA